MSADRDIVKLENGKYTFVKEGVEFRCDRYGEEWMDFGVTVAGNRAIVALFDRVLELEGELKALKAEQQEDEDDMGTDEACHMCGNDLIEVEDSKPREIANGPYKGRMMTPTHVCPVCDCLVHRG